MENKETLYSKISEYIRNKIENEEILPDERIPTEGELSALFNVSRITSKRAMEELERERLIYRRRGKGSFVAHKEEIKVEIQSKPNISSVESKIIAIVAPFPDSSGMIMQTINGILEVLNLKGYYLTVHNFNYDIEKERNLIKSLYNDQVRGIIYYPLCANKNYDFLYNLVLNRFPIVTIDKYFEGIDISYVMTDNFDGSYKAVSYLIKLGHKRIAYLADNRIDMAVSVRLRYYGYCNALINNGFPIDDTIIKLDLYSQFNVDLDGNIKGEEYNNKLGGLVKDLMNMGVTAIHTENDDIAINLISICNNIGIKVPEQISIIGFDNLDISEQISVPLTTIEQNFHEIGKMAAEVIINKIENGNNNYEKIILPAKLIERESCCNVLESIEILSRE